MKIKIFFVVIFLCSLKVNAQQPLAKTLLWKITGPGITKPSYLYGTIHLMYPDEIKVSDSLRAKFYSTQKLFLEIDMSDASMMMKMMQGIKMKNDTTLQQLLSKEQYDSLSFQFKKITGMPLNMMNAMKPELIETMIYPSILGCQGEAWEQKFMQLAKATNMQVKGLEDIEDQVKIFDEIPYKVQAEELAETLNNIDSTKQSFNALLNLYRKKDVDSLNKMINSDESISTYEDLLLNNRNKKWILEIIQQAKIQPTFFAVGAGHLAGEKGVIHLLIKQGYTISPVYY